MKNLLIISVMSALAIILYSCRNKAETQAEPEQTKVKTLIVSKEKITVPVHTSGVLVPAREIRLSFKTGGIIDAIYADDGSHVKKGELIASLDMSEINAQVGQAMNGYDKAFRDYTRAKNLYEDSVATLEQMQNAETALNVAKAMRDAAVFNSAHSKISAPENGVILKRLAQVHEVIAPGYPVFIFGTRDTHWKIKASVADRDYVRIMPGDSAIITFDAYPGKEFAAIVTQLSEASNPMTGTYEAELEMNPVSERMASGFLAGVKIFPLRRESHYQIPVEAIVEADGKQGYVYVIDDSLVARKTAVGIAGIFDSRAAIDSGITADQVIVTEGAAYLTDGEKVEIIE